MSNSVLRGSPSSRRRLFQAAIGVLLAGAAAGWLLRPAHPVSLLPEPLKAVQYFQADASLRTFWNNVDQQQLARDFAVIKSAGFNAIILMIPRGEFQPTVRPVSYDSEILQRLHAVLQEARRQQFWVILRMGSHEILPRDAAGGDYWSGAVLSDEEEFEAYRDLFREIARQTAQYPRMIYFWSWEDVYLWPKPWFAELPANRRAFQEWCRSRNASLAFWSGRWGESLAQWEDVAIPDSRNYAGDAKVGDFWAFQDSLILRRAPVLADALREGNPNGLIGYEARIDPDDTYHHRATFQALSDYDFVASWYYPYHGVPLTHVAPLQRVQHAMRELSWQLDTVRAWAGKPVFFEQIGAELRDEDTEHQRAFLVRATEFLLTESLGYGIWAWQDYPLNFVYNPGFERGLVSWQPEGSVDVLDGEGAAHHGRRAVRLQPGAQISQRVNGSGGRYFTCWARSAADSELSITIERFRDGQLTERREERVEVSTTFEQVRIEWPPEEEATSAVIRVRVPETSDSFVALDRVRAYNHLSRLGICDETGAVRQPLFDQIKQVNLREGRRLRWTLWNRWWRLLRALDLSDARFDYAQPPGQGL